MIDLENFERIRHSLPLLQDASPQLLDEFRESAYLARIPTGRDIFVEGDRVDAIALLVSGVVRVYNIGVTGREITLYRFGLGGSCILTANAIFNDQSFPAIATVEEDAEAVLIPAETFRDWVHRYDLWRNFVIDLLSQRLSSLMEVIDEVAFQRMDARIAAFLLERSNAENPIHITHQEIAAELGSSREVVSRILEDFSNQGIIRAKRGIIEILDFGSLKNRAVM
jgi:CRP/FNR family transcriptional regulator